jgi:hypothetical protein
MKRPTLSVAMDNPYYSSSHPESQTNPRTVVVSLRDSSIVTLAAHGVIDANQVEAAWRFGKAWQTIQSLGNRSAGFGEWVDSSYRSADVAESRIKAAGDLRKAKRVLGDHGYMLVSKVCGEGWHIRDLYHKRGERDAMTLMLRIHLASLARIWC